jgi:hypothetical protein
MGGITMNEFLESLGYFIMSNTVLIFVYLGFDFFNTLTRGIFGYTLLVLIAIPIEYGFWRACTLHVRGVDKELDT